MKRASILVACLVIAAVVVGEPLADTVTGPTLALTEASPYEYVSGSTLYYAPTGSNSGSFTVTASASATSGIGSVDFPAVFGSDSASDSTSPYSQDYSWTSAASASGANTVTAHDGDGDQGTATFTVTPDTAGPTGVSAALNGGPGFSTLSVPLTLNSGTDAGVGVDSSANVVQRATGTLAGGSCGSFGSYASVTLSGNTDTSVATGHCYRYQYVVTDRVGNKTTSSPSADALVDASAPTVTLTAPTEVSGGENQYWSSSTKTLWFQPTKAGSFTLAADASDAESGVSQVAFPDLTGTSGWSGSGGTDTSAAFASGTYAWTAGAAAPGAKSVIATNGIGGTGTGTVTISSDPTPPTGQTVALNGGPWFTTLSVPLTIGAGTDAGSGIDSTRGSFLRASASLRNGICGTFDSTFSKMTWSGAADTTVASGNCYRYEYVAADNVGNESTASKASDDAKVDTTPPTTPSLLFTGLSSAAASGSTVYYRPGASGNFTVTAAATDGDSGVASYTFSSVSGFTAAGTGGMRTYRFTGAPSMAPASLSVTATNAAGLTSAPASFTLVPDATPPTVTVRCNGKPCLTAAYKKAVTVTLSAADGAGSGIDTIRYTTDGSTPGQDSGVAYTKSFTVRTLTHLKVRAYDKAGNPSTTAIVTVRSLADRLVFAAPARVSVKVGARYLQATISSTARAIVRATLRGPGLQKPQRWSFVIGPGATIVRLRLPAGLRGGRSYTLVWSVQAGSKQTSKTTRVVLGPPKG